MKRLSVHYKRDLCGWGDQLRTVTGLITIIDMLQKEGHDIEFGRILTERPEHLLLKHVDAYEEAHNSLPSFGLGDLYQYLLWNAPEIISSVKEILLKHIHEKDLVLYHFNLPLLWLWNFRQPRMDLCRLLEFKEPFESEYRKYRQSIGDEFFGVQARFDDHDSFSVQSFPPQDQVKYLLDWMDDITALFRNRPVFCTTSNFQVTELLKKRYNFITPKRVPNHSRQFVDKQDFFQMRLFSESIRNFVYIGATHHRDFGCGFSMAPAYLGNVPVVYKAYCGDSVVFE